jgi:mono/diheme cytochrome c family protein
MRGVAIGLAGAGALAVVAWMAMAQQPDDAVEGLTFAGESVTAAEVALGQEVYAQGCASCHGANLEGQPDWRRRLENGRMPAPPHDETGHTWHHADRHLFTITKEGVGAVVPGYESDMPAFGDSLTDAEIRAVLAYIKSTWPERERAFQAEVTAKAGAGR